MRVAWRVFGLGLIAASTYLSSFYAAERAAHGPGDFANLAGLLASICGAGAGLVWALTARKPRTYAEVRWAIGALIVVVLVWHWTATFYKAAL